MAIRPIIAAVASNRLAPGALDEVTWRIDHALEAAALGSKTDPDPAP